jgi:RNA polymerase sigma-B factor
VRRCESRPGREEAGPLVTATLRTTIVPLLTAASTALRHRRGGSHAAFDAPRPDTLSYDTILGSDAAHSAVAPAALSHARLVELPPSPPAAGRGETVELLRRMGALGPEDGLRASLREAVIRDHMRHAWYIAALYRSRDVAGEDDVQLAYRSLATAVDGFDPECGGSFLGYAVPVILREVKASRHGDAGQLGASRRARQAAEALCASARELTRELRRSPSVPELAVAMGESCEDVVESLDAALGYAMALIDLPESASPDITGPGQDDARGDATSRETFAVVFALLEDRAKQVLLMRFLRQMSPAQIAAELDVQPEQVSRLLDQSLGRLGAVRDNPPGAPADTPHEITAQPARSGPGLLAT